MTNLELLAYFSKVATEQVLNPDIQLGHIYASVLSVQQPKLHDQVFGAIALDPYLTDDNIGPFTEWMFKQVNAREESNG